MKKKALIWTAVFVGLTTLGASSAIASAVVSEDSTEYDKAPEVMFDSDAVTLGIVALGPIGTVVVCIRWVYYRFFR